MAQNTNFEEPNDTTTEKKQEDPVSIVFHDPTTTTTATTTATTITNHRERPEREDGVILIADKTNERKTFSESDMEKYRKSIRKQINAPPKEWVLNKTFEPPKVKVRKPPRKPQSPEKKSLNLFCRKMWRPEYLLVVIIGIILAIMAFVVNLFCWVSWEMMLLMWDQPQISQIGEFYGVLMIKLFCILTSVYITTYRPAAAGSGVPQLRAILGGIWIRNYLGLATLAVKYFAMLFALASALPTGIEGPFLHVSAIVARQLTKLKWFRHVDRIQVLGAACGGALGAAFGAPIGGALFSIELTRTFYPVPNYWTAFACGIVGSSMIKLFLSSIKDVHFFQTYAGGTPTNFVKEGGQAYQVEELIFSLFLGLMCGTIGLLFIKTNVRFALLRRKYQTRYLGTNPYGITILVVIFFSALQFFVGYFAFGPTRGAFNDLFGQKDLTLCKGEELHGVVREDCYFNDWASRNVIWNLILAAIVHFFFTAAIQPLPFPAGVVAPALTLGLFLGRAVGEILVLLFSFTPSLNPDPRVYAVVGAASMMASITKTISPAVILMEITKETTLLPPMLLSVLVSCGIVAAYGESFFDSGMRLRGIPMLPVFPSELYKLVSDSSTNTEPDTDTKKREPPPPSVSPITSLSSQEIDNNLLILRMKVASDIMEETPFVPVKPQPDELVRILVDYTLEWFPLVHSTDDPVLIGEVSRHVLLEFLQAIAPDIVDQQIPIEAQSSGAPHVRRQSFRQLNLDAISKDLVLQPFDAHTAETPRRRELQGQKLNFEEMPDEEKKLHEKYGKSLMEGEFVNKINFTPFQVTSTMPITKIYTLFHILRLANVYVTDRSQLVGVITEVHLLDLEKAYIDKQNAELWSCCSSLWKKKV